MDHESCAMIARRVGEPLFCVQRIVGRLKLAPAARFGNVGAFSPEQVRAVEAELARVRAVRAKRQRRTPAGA